MIVERYVLDLYCDTRLVCDPMGFGERGGACNQYSGDNKKQALKSAVQHGWVFAPDGKTVTCPRCVLQQTQAAEGRRSWRDSQQKG